MSARQTTAIALPSTSTALSAVASGAAHVARTYPKTTSYYVIGLLAALLFSGWTLSPEQLGSYGEIMGRIDTELEYDLAVKTQTAYSAYYASSGWFSCDSACTRLKARHDSLKADLDLARAAGYELVADAKSQAGIFSEMGVGEVRDSFWAYFSKGAKFAKRQSMYDALFMGFRSMGRNESTGEYVMKMVMQMFMNFSMGLVLTFGMFLFGLWAIITSYRASLLEGLLFFFFASAAGFATVMTVFGGMSATLVGGGFAVAKLAEAQGRLQDGGAGGRRRVGQRAHWE
ncbi:hypothetical protein TeGR_g4464 [Tetraparma gracilis]|uniref:Uncharacterized protein n=1 Tax=Tetraparma gracilis TaxID=2962635 RepID=A0ABQ6MAQ3_9STRA|nr:hypothetical protein TeGR_g4464 [Tetraparma gracilis]